MSSPFEVVDASIADLRHALESGRATAAGLLESYLERIAVYDHAGIRLNAVVVLNPQARDDAAASDVRRAAGRTRGPLDGIPYTAKDSYLARGLTAAAGSPAFADLLGPTGRVRDRAAARRRSDPDRPDQHAAQGQRRDAAWTIRARGKSL